MITPNDRSHLGIWRTRNGDVVDVAEWLRFKQTYDVQWQTFRNGATKFTHAQVGVDQEVFSFGIDVPEGRELIVFSESFRLTENAYEIELLRAPDGFTGGTEITKDTMRDNGVETVQTDVYADVTPSGTLTLREEDAIDVGSTPGAGRISSVASLDDVLVTMTAPHIVRITRVQGNSSYTLAFRLIAWEEDA